MWRTIVVLVLLVPQVLHDVYHLADWVDWGLGSPALLPIADLLFPLYGSHDLVGFSVHAITQLLAWVAVFLLVWWGRPPLKVRRARGCSYTCAKL